MFIRVPLSILSYLITQVTTKAVRDLPSKLSNAGFIIESIRLNRLENFIEIVARKPG